MELSRLSSPGGSHRNMLVTPADERQSAALDLVLGSVARCQECPPGCDGMRWVWDPVSGTAVRRMCMEADAHTNARAATELIEASGVPAGTRPIVCKWLRHGITVVCPPWKVTTLDEELSIRNVTAGIVVGWIMERQSPAIYHPYYMTRSFWRDDISLWKNIPLIAFVGWHFRGLREEHAAAFNDVLLSRLDKGLPTVVSLSADPTMLLPRWQTDEAVVDAIRRPDFFVRVSKSKPIATKGNWK